MAGRRLPPRLRVGALTERDAPGFLAKLRGKLRADPSARPLDATDRLTRSGHQARNAMQHGEWSRGVGWLDAAVVAAVDAADAASRRTGLGDASQVRRAGDGLSRALKALAMTLPEARAVAAAALAG